MDSCPRGADGDSARTSVFALARQWLELRAAFDGLEILAGAGEIAHGFLFGVGHPHRRELTGPVEPGQCQRVGRSVLTRSVALRGIRPGATTMQSWPICVN